MYRFKHVIRVCVKIISTQGPLTSLFRAEHSFHQKMELPHQLQRAQVESILFTDEDQERSKKDGRK